jgi:hypothetical protein
MPSPSPSRVSAASCAAAWLGWSEHVAAARAVGGSAVEAAGHQAIATNTASSPCLTVISLFQILEQWRAYPLRLAAAADRSGRSRDPVDGAPSFEDLDVFAHAVGPHGQHAKRPG